MLFFASGVEIVFVLLFVALHARICVFFPSSNKLRMVIVVRLCKWGRSDIKTTKLQVGRVRFSH